jgi:hypothetical protein
MELKPKVIRPCGLWLAQFEALPVEISQFVVMYGLGITVWKKAAEVILGFWRDL